MHPERAVLFIDGNNWYHALRNVGIGDLSQLDYAKISTKLVGPRLWQETRYYIGQVRNEPHASRLYNDQQRFLASLRATDARITTHLGRLESRPVDDPVAAELAEYLNNLQVRLDPEVYHDLLGIAGRRRVEVMVEKAVDVMLAVDMVTMAERNQLDTAYLLSADGDYTPAVESVSAHGKKTFAVSPLYGGQLASVVTSFIRLRPDWFDDCYK